MKLRNTLKKLQLILQYVLSTIKNIGNLLIKAQIKALDYWKLNANTFPVLSIIAREYLAITATSAPSERIFSIAANIITKNRNRLAKDTFKMIILLKNWGVIKDNEEDLLESEEED